MAFPHQTGAFIVLCFHLLWKIYIVGRLSIYGWLWYPEIGDFIRPIDFFMGLNVLNIAAIVILLLAILSVVKKKPSVAMLNVVIFYFLVDMISVCFGMYMMFKSLQDRILDFQNEIDSLEYPDEDEDEFANEFKKSVLDLVLSGVLLLKEQFTEKVYKYFFLVLVIQLSSMLVVYCFRVKVQKTLVQSNVRRIPQASAPQFQQMPVYYIPASADGSVPPLNSHQYPQYSIPPYYDANPHVVGFK